MSNGSNKKFWNTFAKFYSSFMEKDRGVYDNVCGYIYPYLNKDMNILELACGSGQFSFRLSKYTKHWIGTDFSEQMILEAKKRGEQQFKDYLREQNLSTVEMNLVHGGLAPIGVMIAKKKQ